MLNNEAQKIDAVITGFVTGDSAQMRLIKGKIIQYVHHQKFGNDRECEELIAEVLDILYDNLRNQRFRGDSLKALNVYIYNTVRYRINRVIRRRTHQVAQDPAQLEVADNAESALDRLANSEMVKKVMEALDPLCRQLLSLKFLECWSDDEISHHLKKTKNATSTAISRCVGKTRKMKFLQDWL